MNEKHTAIIAINQHSFVLYANEGLYDVFGWKPEELVGKLITEIMPESYRKMHILGMDRYMISGVKGVDWRSTKLQGLKKDGSIIPIEISFGEYERDGEPHFVGLICNTDQTSLRDDLKTEMIQTIVDKIYESNKER